ERVPNWDKAIFLGQNRFEKGDRSSIGFESLQRSPAVAQQVAKRRVASRKLDAIPRHVRAPADQFVEDVQGLAVLDFRFIPASQIGQPPGQLMVAQGDGPFVRVLRRGLCEYLFPNGERLAQLRLALRPTA